MNSVDFVLYCVGTGTLLVSAACAVRLIGGISLASAQKPATPPAAPIPQRAPVPDPIEEGLGARIKALQNTRFGAPITTRTLTPDMGPPIRPYSRPQQPDFTPRAPGPTQVKLPPRTALRTVPPVREREVVISLPTKMKTDAPKKDE